MAEQKNELLEVSDDAKAIMGGIFGLGLTDLSFSMGKSKPSPRAQAALDELVEAQAVFKESINQAGGMNYKPLIDAKPYAAWFRKNLHREDLKFPLGVPL